MKILSSFKLGCIAFFLGGCIDPRDMETEPVQVQTSSGIVTCQLYRRDRVLWDRAIHRPETMSVEEADEVCRAEGERLATAR